MKKPSANKKKVLAAKGWKYTTVSEFLNLTPEESATIELRLLATTAFPDADIAAASDERIEFHLARTDENLNSAIQEIFKLGNCKFSLMERTTDWKIKVVLSR